MPRYIDADKLINESKLDEFGCFDWSEVLAVITDEKLAPTEDVQPVAHAKWEEITTHNGCTPDYDCVCSNCKESGVPSYKYCPNCGSKMR